MHVLLVEPDVVLQRVYAGSLENEGHTVAVTSTAQSAVQAADQRKPDVVVVNIDMPRHNGVEFLYEFTSYSEWHGTPVILLASHLNHDLANYPAVRHQLGVRKVLVRTQVSLTVLCETVAAVGEARESA